MEIDLMFQVARKGFFFAIPKAKFRCFQLARKTGLDIRLDTSQRRSLIIHVSWDGKKKEVNLVQLIELVNKYFKFL